MPACDHLGIFQSFLLLYLWLLAVNIIYKTIKSSQLLNGLPHSALHTERFALHEISAPKQIMRCVCNCVCVSIAGFTIGMHRDHQKPISDLLELLMAYDDGLKICDALDMHCG